MSVDAGVEVQRAISLLKALDFMMGVRDKGFDKIVKDALVHLNNARAGLSAGPAPVNDTGLDPSIVEWLHSCADGALAQAGAAGAEAEKESVLSSALLSIREWAARLLEAPAPPGAGPGISTPRGIR